MDRFVSRTAHRVDSKGRVSIPAHLRLVLGQTSLLHTIFSVEYPVAECGGEAFVEANRKRLATMDPLSEEYEVWSFYLEGDADQLKIDPEGRIALTDNIRQHTGITDTVVFVGRGSFFQMWEPEAFQQYREAARDKVLSMRRTLSQLNSPANRSGRSEDTAFGSRNTGSDEEQD